MNAANRAGDELPAKLQGEEKRPAKVRGEDLRRLRICGDEARRERSLHRRVINVGRRIEEAISY